MNCASGGYAIETGRDKNGNGVLDPSEVSDTVYVCDPTQPARQLVAVIPEPPGTNCPSGGQAIEVGLDSNGDGSLEATEVSAVSYVCSGPPGVQTLVAVVAEPPGANCPLGGEAIEAGADTNDNGVLESGEVTSTSYVCSVEGDRTVVRVDIEPPGANCGAGGNAIHVGFDTNADGQLEDSEIQSTTYLCGPPANPTTVDGDVIINNSLDVAALDGVTAITGNVTIASSTLSSISLPDLTSIGGTLSCGPCPQLASLSLPALNSVFAIDLRNHVLASIAFSSGLVPTSNGLLALGSIENSTLPLGSLTSANLQIDSAPNLTSISLDSLTTGGVTVGSAPQLASVSLQAFQSGTVSIRNDVLTTLALPAMTDGSIALLWPSTLSSFSAPLLTHATVTLQLDSSTLTSLDLPSLRTGAVDVSGAPALASLSVPQLENATLVLDGVALATLSLPALQSGGYIMLSHLAQLSSFSAPNLASNAAILIASAPQLTQLSLPALTHTTNISLQDNATLASISMPVLQSGGGQFTATDNPMLPTCLATALATQGHWCACTTQISGNDDAATCQ